MSGALVSMEFGQLEDLLRPAIEQHLQGMQAAACDAPVATCNIDALMGTLHRLVCDPNGGAGAGGSMAGLGVQVPQVDEELVGIQAEVDTILQRLSECRKSVPVAVAAAMQSQLQALRPPTELPPAGEQPHTSGAAASDAQPGDAAASSEPAVLQEQGAAAVAAEDEREAAALHEMMTAALAKLPALRARLEAAEARLARNLAAAEGEISRPSPRTVERVMLNRTNMMDEAPPASEGALPGSAMTKRRLARELA